MKLIRPLRISAAAALFLVAASMGAVTADDLLFGHFPDRAHAVVWRNWHAVEVEEIADVLGTSPENVTEMARSMGLPPAAPIPPEQKTKGYFWMTLCRRNWHLLPMEQLAALLDTTPNELFHFLKVEEHANWHILGGFKPECPAVKYMPPDAPARRRAAQIKSVVEAYFHDSIRVSGEPRFAFVRRLSEPLPKRGDHDANLPSSDPPRFICSYLKIYGDPLMDPDVDMYPEGLLQRLAAQGVNGVWLYGVLRHLAPGGPEFPEFGEDHEIRQKNLRTLTARAGRYGIGVYLYINEPRSQPAAFFANRPGMAGADAGQYGKCMCTSDPRVRKWIGDALADLFTNVPDLAGVFTISASENPTNCAWGGEHTKAGCPHCKDRKVAEILAEVAAAIDEGVHRGNPNAKVLAWDWGWPGGGVATEAISLLPKSTWLMSVSEWSLPIDRGGVRSRVGEYSISAVGPGPRAAAHWAAAKKAGLKTAAKIQLNTTWELSSLPYLPALDLVAEHCHNLASADVDGLMLSWSLGGYPSPNLRVAQLLQERPVPDVDSVVRRVALERYGPEGADAARKAYAALSRGLREYPYTISLLYHGPMQLGPANPVYAKPTGLNPTMVGFPFDDLSRWRGPYPPNVLASQFEKTAAGWTEGVALLEQAAAKTPPRLREEVEEELLFARAAGLYFRSAANQVRYILSRNALLNPETDDVRRKEHREVLHRALTDEIAVATEMYSLAKANSCVGFEAASQYFYLPLDLVEKVVNCRAVLDQYQRRPE